MGFKMLIFFTRQSDISEIGVTSHIFERTMNIMSRQNFSDMFVTTTVLSGLGGATCFSVLATPQQLHSSLLLQQREIQCLPYAFLYQTVRLFLLQYYVLKAPALYPVSSGLSLGVFY